MLSPIYIFIIALGTAFLLSLFDRFGRHVSILVFLAALTAMTAVSVTWTGLLTGETLRISTAGFQPPFSINLQIGTAEGAALFAINLIGLIGALYMLKRFKQQGVLSMVLFLMMIMGVNGMIMTRDLFNLFVFMEISSIATYSMIGLEHDSRSLAAGFKYMIAGGLATFFFLIGTIFLYYLTGTLNIDGMIESQQLISGKIGFIAVFLLLFAILIELKPFPANGWALDVYQTASSGIVAIIAVVNSAGMLFALYKILPLAKNCLSCIAIIGLSTFLFANLLGLKQQDAKRLLGYSSIAQMGFVISALALLLQFSQELDLLVLIVGGLFINHFIAKAGLFWLAGFLKTERIQDWGKNIGQWELGCREIPIPALQKQSPRLIPAAISRSLFLVIFGSFLLALLGFPPFPGFWAKWELLRQLFAHDMGIWAGAILLASLLEAAYLLRWFGYAVQNQRADSSQEPATQALDLSQAVPIASFALLLFSLGIATSMSFRDFPVFHLLPLIAVALLAVTDFQVNAKIQGLATLALSTVLSIVLLPKLSGIYLVFGLIFILGSLVQIIATFVSPFYKGGIEGISQTFPDKSPPAPLYERGECRRQGFYPLLLLLILSLGMLLLAQNSLQFFFHWELMTLSSYLLILRGRKAIRPALHYIIFSTAGAFFLLAGFTLAASNGGGLALSSLSGLGFLTPKVYMLLAVGFLVKLGALGLHVWLPGAYAEAEDDVSSLISSVLSKVGIFGFFVLATTAGDLFFGHIYIAHILGWIGVLTALFGAFMAVFQEDIKVTLAYSSMGQIGYILLAFAAMSHLGWTTALYLSLTHLFFKAMLFLAIAGVVYRTKTRLMYQMGGLIKQMPFSFVSVLIAIIALSGVPPLSGFGGKWLLYVTLFEKGWYLQLAVAFFASGVAFLYLFRLIHTIFLGQPKPQLKHVSEAPVTILVPQYIFLAAIMAISTFPNLIIKPLSQAVAPFYASTLSWEGFTLKTSLGYWNGFAVMNVTMIIFALPLIWLLLVMRKPQWVKQFNIVYAAERPDRPETTHFAHNFFAHYNRALGFMVTPLATRFWNAVSEWAHSLAGSIRTIYTGNGQTYALHIMLFMLVFYLMVR